MIFRVSFTLFNTGGLCRGEFRATLQVTYRWPDTEPGHSVSQLCQYGSADQNITTFCNGNLTWTENASKCPTLVSVRVNQLNILVENASRLAYFLYFNSLSGYFQNQRGV